MKTRNSTSTRGRDSFHWNSCPGRRIMEYAEVGKIHQDYPVEMIPIPIIPIATPQAASGPCPSLAMDLEPSRVTCSR